MSLKFTKASKAQSKLRAALFGPSGAGKTFSALRIATGMGKALGLSVAVIDTEHGSASKYADRFEFDTVQLDDDQTIDAYCEALQAAAEAGYGVVIIDSLSHGWQELLQEVDRLARTRYKGNSWSAWSEGTPKQRQLVNAILKYPGHVIATIRSKTEWTTEDGKNGKSKPVRVGLTPEQGKGIEYEFDLLLELSADHTAECIKDRTGKYQDRIIDKPGEDFGAELAAWLTDGAPPPEPDREYRATKAVSPEAKEWSGKIVVLGEMLYGDGLEDKVREILDGFGRKSGETYRAVEDLPLPMLKQWHAKWSAASVYEPETAEAN